MGGPRVWNPAGRCPSSLRKCRGPPIFPGWESNQMVCGAALQVAGRASSAWGVVGTRWQMSVMGVPRAVLSCFLLGCSTLRL